MKLTSDPQRDEWLAASYALGTLQGGARRRFESRLHQEPALRALAARWEEHLAPLNEAIAPLAVPTRVWRGIERRLPVLARAQKPRSWFDSLAVWRASAGLALAVAVFSVSLAWLVSTQAPPAATVVAVTPPSNSTAVPSVSVASEHYVATFADPKTGRAVALVYADASGDTIRFKVLDAKLQLSADQVLELWTAAPSGKGMLPAGLVPIARTDTVQSVSVPDAPTLRNATLLGLSVEPAGGSPAPTHVLGVAQWVRIES
jgi:anti-sigma-K factor RskA